MIAIAVAAFFFLSSSDKDDETSTSSTTTKKPNPQYVAPLTGLVDSTGESENREALAIKIGNNPEARPQAGINEADIMYEEVVEGGITRYMGVYHSQVPERVGPVRSVRGMDPNIALNWGGVFAYSGGSSANEEKIQSTEGIVALNETAAGSGMKRDSARSIPNNLYALPSVLFEENGTPVPPRAQFTYSKTAPTATETASIFTVGFQSGYASTWTYNAETNSYLRAYGTKPVVDQEGVQVSYENVVVQWLEYPADSEGITTGSGQLWVFRNGKVIKGTWERPSNKNPAEFLDSNGDEIALTPGKTWIALPKSTMTVTVTP